MRTTETTSSGEPIMHLWNCPMPDLDKPGAGFPVLDRAVHGIVYEATREMGAYNHHSKLACRHGRFYAMWSNHPHGEDGPGQRVVWSRSVDASAWSAVEVLFPRPGPVKPSEETGLSLTAFRWIQFTDRLFAVAGLHENIGFTDCDRVLEPVPVRDAAHPSRARKGYSPLVREILAGDRPGPVFWLWDNPCPELEFDALSCDDHSVADGATMVRQVYGSPRWLPAWDFEGRLGYPVAEDGHRLCEPAVYQAGDGRHVMLLRDTRYSHRMYVSISADNGKTWPVARPTDIPDSPSLACTLNLDDGTILLVGNQMAPVFDNAADKRHYNRDPLTVSISDDGYRFTRCYALRCGVQQFRVDGVRGRGGGGQYPSAIVHDDRLYVQYSMGKEDVWVSHVSLADMGL